MAYIFVDQLITGEKASNFTLDEKDYSEDATQPAKTFIDVPHFSFVFDSLIIQFKIHAKYGPSVVIICPGIELGTVGINKIKLRLKLLPKNRITQLNLVITNFNIFKVHMIWLKRIGKTVPINKFIIFSNNFFLCVPETLTLEIVHINELFIVIRRILQPGQELPSFFFACTSLL